MHDSVYNVAAQIGIRYCLCGLSVHAAIECEEPNHQDIRSIRGAVIFKIGARLVCSLIRNEVHQ